MFKTVKKMTADIAVNFITNFYFTFLLSMSGFLGLIIIPIWLKKLDYYRRFSKRNSDIKNLHKRFKLTKFDVDKTKLSS